MVKHLSMVISLAKENGPLSRLWKIMIFESNYQRVKEHDRFFNHWQSHQEHVIFQCITVCSWGYLVPTSAWMSWMPPQSWLVNSTAVVIHLTWKKCAEDRPSNYGYIQQAHSYLEAVPCHRSWLCCARECWWGWVLVHELSYYGWFWWAFELLSCCCCYCWCWCCCCCCCCCWLPSSTL